MEMTEMKCCKVEEQFLQEYEQNFCPNQYETNRKIEMAEGENVSNEETEQERRERIAENKRIAEEAFALKPFIVNPELEKIVPKLSDEKFKELESSIRSFGLRKPIDVMPDKTIIDGHHRYKACKELGKLDYTIQFTVLDINQIQEALEYSIEINLKRRQLNIFQTATWALDVYGKNCYIDEISRKTGVPKNTLNIIKSLNQMLDLSHDTAKMTELRKELNSGEIGFREAYNQLKTAAEIDTKISVITDKKFKSKLTEKYETLKYKKPAPKQLDEDISEHDNPKPELTRSELFHKEVEPIADKINKLAEKYNDEVTVLNATNEEMYNETIEYITGLKASGKIYAVVLFELPKELEPTPEESMRLEAEKKLAYDAEVKREQDAINEAREKQREEKQAYRDALIATSFTNLTEEEINQKLNEAGFD